MTHSVAPGQFIQANRLDADAVNMPFLVQYTQIELVATGAGNKPRLLQLTNNAGTIGPGGNATLVPAPAGGAAAGSIVRHDTRDITFESPSGATIPIVVEVVWTQLVPSLNARLIQLTIPLQGKAVLENGSGRWTIYDSTGAVVNEGGGGGGGPTTVNVNGPADPGVMIDNTLRIQAFTAVPNATNAVTYKASYLTVEAPETREGITDANGALTGPTPVTIVPVPTGTKYALLKACAIHNPDTIAHTVTVRVLNGVLNRNLVQQTIQPGETLTYRTTGDWIVLPIPVGGGGSGTPQIVDPGTQGGRMSLDVASPTTETSGLTIYFHPYDGDKIAIPDALGDWSLLDIPTAPVSVIPAVPGTMFDVYALDSGGGTLALSLLAWPGLNTPPARTLLDGVWVQTADPTRRLVGSVYQPAAGNMIDGGGTYHLSNVDHPLRRTNTNTLPTYNYNSPTFRVVGATIAFANVVCVNWGAPSRPVQHKYQVLGIGGGAGSSVALAWSQVSGETPPGAPAVSANATIAFDGQGAVSRDFLTTHSVSLIGVNVISAIESVNGGTAVTFVFGRLSVEGEF